MAKKKVTAKQKVVINGEEVAPITKHKLWEQEGWGHKEAMDHVRRVAAEKKSKKTAGS